MHPTHHEGVTRQTDPGQLRRVFARAPHRKNVLDIIPAIAVKTISNYLNHVLHTEVDAMFTEHAPSPKS